MFYLKSIQVVFLNSQKAHPNTPSNTSTPRSRSPRNQQQSAPEHRPSQPGPKRKQTSSNHPIFRCKLAVRFRDGNHLWFKTTDLEISSPIESSSTLVLSTNDLKPERNAHKIRKPLGCWKKWTPAKNDPNQLPAPFRRRKLKVQDLCLMWSWKLDGKKRV